MKVFGVFLIICMIASVLAACEPVPSVTQTSDPSPPASIDKTRLWVLIQASRFGDGSRCSNYFRAPHDERYRSRAEACLVWTLDFADYLQLNGLPTVRATHLRDPSYWQWFETFRQAVLECQHQYVPQAFNANETEAERLKRTAAKYACDPYQDARKNSKQSLEDLGIRFAAKAAHTRFEYPTAVEQ